MKVNRITKEKFESLGFKVNQNIYTNTNPIVREIFWRRLDRLISLYNFSGKTVLDFGCGEGALLPTLSKISDKVYGIDMNAKAAKQIVEMYKLSNVDIINADINNYKFDISFDAVICADVLEHFKDLSVPISYIRNVLNRKGNLLISVPSENFLYVVGRAVFGFTKPEDHYHASKDIIKFITKNGFKLIKKYGYPFGMPYQLSAFELCVFEKE